MQNCIFISSCRRVPGIHKAYTSSNSILFFLLVYLLPVAFSSFHIRLKFIFHLFLGLTLDFVPVTLSSLILLVNLSSAILFTFSYHLTHFLHPLSRTFYIYISLLVSKFIALKKISVNCNQLQFPSFIPYVSLP